MIGAKQIGAALFALLLVTSGAAVAASGSLDVGTATQESDEKSSNVTEHADEVYVSENGDAVLVYEESNEDPNARAVSGEFGLDGQAGLMHVLYRGNLTELEDSPDEELNATGSAEIQMTPDTVSGGADVTSDKPENLSSLSIDARSERTRQQSTSSVDAELVVETEEDQEFSSVDVESTTKITGTTFESSGSMSAVSNEAQQDGDQSVDLTVTETAGGYELVASERRTVDEWERNRWDTRENASESLESQYAGIAMQLGGTADVSLEEHAFDEGTDSVTVEYAVTFDGVKEQVAEELARTLAEDRELDLDEQEAQEITNRMAELHFERVHLSARTSETEASMEWDVEVHNYDEFVLGMIQIAESVDELDDDLADQYDDIREMLEAQEAAGLVQTSSWELSIEAEDDRLSYAFSGQTDAENWEAYVNELEDRGVVEYVVETSYDFSAETEGEDLQTQFEFEVTRDDFLDEFLEEMVAAAEEDDELDEEAVRSIENFRDAEFEVAKANVSIDDDEFTMRSAAKFENLSSFENYPIESEEHNFTVTDIYGVTEDDATTIYVTVEDFASEDAEESEIRESGHVSEDTEVYMPDEWDSDDIPSMDVESVIAYLDAGEDDSGLLPVGAAAVAAGLVALLAVVGGGIYYRRQQSQS